MQLLRTNTATRVTVGPIYDTDGLTPKTVLTVTGLKLSMTVDDGGVPTLVLDTAPTASGGANDMVHITGDDSGFFDLELAAANVNYLGRAKLALSDAANICPVFHEYLIVPANVYDALVLGSDVLQVDVSQWKDATAPAMTGDAFARLGAPAGASIAADVATRASQTSVDDVPTNAELATALGTADDAVLSAINALNNLSSAGAQAAAAAALTAYSAATAANVTAVPAAVLAAAASNPIASNIKEINDVVLTGAGVIGDEFGP